MEPVEFFYPLLWELNFERLLGMAQATRKHYDLIYLTHFTEQYIEGLMEQRGHSVRFKWFDPREHADHSKRFQVVNGDIVVLEGAISVERSLEEMREDEVNNVAYLFDMNFWFRKHFLTNVLVISAKDRLQGCFHQVMNKEEVPWIAGDALLDFEVSGWDLKSAQRMERVLADGLSHCFHTSG